MSKTLLDCSIHNKPWFFDLDAQQKYLFLFLISNDNCTVTGAYEMPMTLIAQYIGSTATKTKELISKMEPYLYYCDGWVVVPEYKNLNPMNNPNIKKAYDKLLTDTPEKIKGLLKGYGRVTKPSNEHEHDNEHEHVMNMGEKKKKKQPLNYESLYPLLTNKQIKKLCDEYKISENDVVKVWKKMLNSRIANGKPYRNWIRGLRTWIQPEIDEGKITQIKTNDERINEMAKQFMEDDSWN